MKRILALLLALTMALCLCACSGNGDNGETTTEATTEATTEETTEQTGVTYKVTVIDESSNPIVGAMVQICQGESCLPGATGEDGVAVFTVAAEAEYEAKFLSLPAGYDYTTDEQVFPFGSATELTIVLKAIA